MSRYVRKGVWGKPRNTRCARCQKDLPRIREHWGPDRRSPDGLSCGWCRRCITTSTKERNRELRANALIHYSNGSPSCACCGEFRYEFLTLDHVHGGGNQHRREVTGSTKGGSSFYKWLKVNGYPDGFQVLCFNCNMAKAMNGKCSYHRAHNPRAHLGKAS